MCKRGLIWDEINHRLLQEMVGSLCNGVCKGILRRAVVSVGELSAPFWFRRTLPHNTMFCSPFLSDMSSLFNKNERLTRQKDQNVNLGRSPATHGKPSNGKARILPERGFQGQPPHPHPPSPHTKCWKHWSPLSIYKTKCVVLPANMPAPCHFYPPSRG